MYNALKTSDRVLEIDGGLTYFIIDVEWVKKWRAFVTKKGPHPGRVINEGIAQKIAKQRGLKTANTYLAHDNLVTLVENEDVYVLSSDFWKMFEHRYHCDYVIQIRKYEKA